MNLSEQELRQLIAEIVVEFLQVQRLPHALVLFSGALLGFETALESLGRLKGTVRCDWTQTPAATRILDQDAIAALGMRPATDSLVQSHDLLIVPTATVNLVAKVTHGIGDCMASNVMAEFIMMNKPVVLATNAASPDSVDKRSWFPAMPTNYQEMLRRNLAELGNFGVHLTSAERLDETVSSVLHGASPQASAASVLDCSERLIHEGIIGSVKPGTQLRVAPGTIITPLARDAAAAAGITVEEV